MTQILMKDFCNYVLSFFSILSFQNSAYKNWFRMCLILELISM